MSEEVRFEFNGKEYYIAPITSSVLAEAQKIYNRTFRKAVEDGCLLKKRLDDYMRDQGLWDDTKQEQYQNLIKEIADLEYKLNKGGLKLSDARSISLSLLDKRNELRALISDRSSLDSQTVEGQADNKRFNYLVSACSYDFLTRKPVYKNLDEYLENADSELAIKLATKFANYLYNVDENYEESLTEHKFLKRFKFIDDKGRLINKEGKLIDREGNFINDEGYRVDAEGKRIDINNNPILETTVEDVEFIDDVYTT